MFKEFGQLNYLHCSVLCIPHSCDETWILFKEWLILQFEAEQSFFKMLNVP